MNISGKALEKLEAWLSPMTWYTNHYSDMGRFHDFVETLDCETDCDLNENHLLERIMDLSKKKHPDFNEEEREKIIKGFVGRASNIVDYLQHVSR